MLRLLISLIRLLVTWLLRLLITWLLRLLITLLLLPSLVGLLPSLVRLLVTSRTEEFVETGTFFRNRTKLVGTRLAFFDPFYDEQYHSHTRNKANKYICPLFAHIVQTSDTHSQIWNKQTECHYKAKNTERCGNETTGDTREGFDNCAEQEVKQHELPEQRPANTAIEIGVVISNHIFPNIK